jgi:phosphate transport system protein
VREHYRQRLGEVQEDLVRMGYQVAEALNGASNALDSWDVELAWKVIAGDELVDRVHVHLEEEVLALMATQQPIATDLRVLLSVLSIASELERMGDYTKGIAKGIVRAVKTPKLLEVPAELRQMCEQDQIMVRACLDAFTRRDAEAAHKLSEDDDAVDELRIVVNEKLIKLMQEDPEAIPCAVELHNIVHNLERLADRTTNVAEQVIFIVTSRFEELNP